MLGKKYMFTTKLKSNDFRFAFHTCHRSNILDQNLVIKSLEWVISCIIKFEADPHLQITKMY